MKLFFRILKISGIVILSLILITVIFMQQKPFGKLPSGERLERIKRSPNYKDGKFQNLHPTSKIAEGVSYVSMMREFFFSKGINRDPLQDIPAIKTNLKTLSDSVSITWFGHSSYLIHDHEANILIDPVLSERASPVQYAGMKSYKGTMLYTPEDFPKIDALILTHDHYDHLDYHTILKFSDKAKKFYVPLGVGSHLEHWGVPAEKIIELDWWDEAKINDQFTLTSTPARHFSGRGFVDNKTLWSSYVLRLNAHTLFIGGDSGYDDSFKKIGEKFGPFDLAILECGQYDAKWPFIHMMPEETVQASVDLHAKVLLPVHWSKFTLALHPWTEPIERALKKAQELNVKVSTPKIGDPYYLNNDLPVTQWWRL